MADKEDRRPRRPRRRRRPTRRRKAARPKRAAKREGGCCREGAQPPKGEREPEPKASVPRLHKHFDEVVRQKLTEQFGYKNRMQVPRVDKIVLNMGVGEARQRLARRSTRPPPTSR